MIRAVFLALMVCLAAPSVMAQNQTLQDLLQVNPDAIADPSRRTVGEVLGQLVDSGLPEVPQFLERWQERLVYQRVSDGLFFYAEETDSGFNLFDISTGEPAGTAAPREVVPLRPNAGVRRVIGSALIQFQLMDPDIARRTAAIDAIASDPSADHLEPLRGAIDGETDAALKDRKIRLERLLSSQFEPDSDTRVAAIGTLASDISVDSRAVLNQILATTTEVAAALPDDTNIAAVLTPGSDDLGRDEAYQMLVDAGFAPPLVPVDAVNAALIAGIVDGQVAGVPVASLDTEEARAAAYETLAAAGSVPPPCHRGRD